MRARISAILASGEARGRLLFLMWLSSLGVMAIGFGIIVLRALGR